MLTIAPAIVSIDQHEAPAAAALAALTSSGSLRCHAPKGHRQANVASACLSTKMHDRSVGYTCSNHVDYVVDDPKVPVELRG
jgi:hypothetical protein